MSLAYRFFLAGAFCAAIGMTMGAYMGSTHDFTYAPVHAHINLVGWVTLFLFGLYYRVEQSAARGILPELHFATAMLGVVLLPLGILGAVTLNERLALAVIPGTIFTLASMALFLAVIIRGFLGQRSAKAAVSKVRVIGITA